LHNIWNSSSGFFLWVGSTVFFKITNPKGVENSKICDSINAGITPEELYKKLGHPIKHLEINGENWVYFRSHPVAAGLIRARIDKTGRKVLVLKCWEDKMPNWDLTKNN